jgi:hypothetical protein
MPWPDWQSHRFAGGERRTKKQNKEQNEKRAYILTSLKRTEEVTLLRDVYGASFFVISAYSPRAARAAVRLRFGLPGHRCWNGNRMSRLNFVYRLLGAVALNIAAPALFCQKREDRCAEAREVRPCGSTSYKPQSNR